MSGTQDLRAEHVAVIRMLDVLEVIAARARAGQPVDEVDLSASLEFLRVFVDRCHHQKEEMLLFPAMRAANLTSAENAIARLLEEHDEGRQAVMRMGAVTERFTCDDKAAGSDLAELISDYSALLRAHIALEEEEALDVADRELPEESQKELEKGYDRIERETIGEGRHEEFHALLERLETKYAPAA